MRPETTRNRSFKRTQVGNWIIIIAMSIVSASCGGRKVVESQQVMEKDARRMTERNVIMHNDSVTNDAISIDSLFTNISIIDSNKVDSIHIAESGKGEWSINIYGINTKTNYNSIKKNKNAYLTHSAKLGDRFIYSSIEADTNVRKDLHFQKTSLKKENKTLRIIGLLCAATLLMYVALSLTIKFVKKRIS